MADLPPPYEVALQQSRPAPAPMSERSPVAPSAPPLEVQQSSFHSPPAAGYGAVTTAGGSITIPIPAADHKGMVESYVSYSIPAKLYSQSCGHQRNETPGNPMSCCISTCLCCCGAVLVAAFVLLPFAMIITSIWSYNQCTGSSSGSAFPRLLPRYLGVGGGLLGLLVCLRITASVLTCCRNRRRGDSTPGFQSKVCICLFEIFVVLWVIANLVLLVVASYFLFKDLPRGTDYCTTKDYYFYYLTVSYMFFQYLLYMLACLFCCLSYCCQRVFR